MEKVVGLDPGFDRRFGDNRITFEAWSPQTAFGSLVEQVEKKGRELDGPAKKAILAKLKILAALPKWASAGDVRTLVNAIEENHALEMLGKAGKKRISAETIDAAFRNLIVKRRASAEAARNEKPADDEGV